MPGEPRAHQPGRLETAARLGITPAQAALLWLLQLAPNVLLLPGTGSVAHLRENLAAEGIALDDERCANWTPLHHGQTIRLVRCQAMTTARDFERVRIAAVTGGAGARGRPLYRRPRPRRSVVYDLSSEASTRVAWPRC
jgi:hypothetical protein